MLFFVNSFGITRIKVPLVNYAFYCSQKYFVVKPRADLNRKLLTDALLKTVTEAFDASRFEFVSKITLFGIGFKSWVCKIKDGLRYIVLKVGFSRDVCVKIPFTIKVIVLKPTLILFKSLDKNVLNQYISFLRSLKTPDSYKGKGLRYVDEAFVLKTGKT